MKGIWNSNDDRVDILAFSNGFINVLVQIFLIDIIFFTSNSGIDLGKEVSQIGIQYYAIKPLGKGELQDSIEAILKLHKKNTIHT